MCHIGSDFFVFQKWLGVGVCFGDIDKLIGKTGGHYLIKENLGTRSQSKPPDGRNDINPLCPCDQLFVFLNNSSSWTRKAIAIQIDDFQLLSTGTLLSSCSIERKWPFLDHALSLGIARGAYEAALQYAKERVQFGKPISSFQGISFKLADMATQIEAAELLTQHASQMINEGKKMTKQSAMCKLYASEACVHIANEAVQIFGGYGYSKEFPVEKFYRDSKLCTIGEGTSEIQKVVIAKQILK